MGSCDTAEEASSSPSREDAKKAVVQAAHTVCLEIGSHPAWARQWPMVRRSGKVTTHRVDRRVGGRPRDESRSKEDDR